MHEARPDAGSCRDPSGRVVVLDECVLRTVAPRATADVEFVRSTGVLQSSIAEGSATAEGQVEPSELLRGFNDARHTLQHSKLPFMSRPYEWRFTALKHAARLHLDVQIRCLEQNVTLSDASAYNVQFEGPKPILIGSLPFRHYHEGEFWIGTSTSASNLSILSCSGRCSGSVATRGTVAASKAPERRHRVRAQVRPAGSASASAKGGHLRRLFRGMFSNHLQAGAEVVGVVDVSASGRRLFWFVRR